MNDNGNWVPVAKSPEEGVSTRTAYNWIKSKKLSSRTENGVTLVDREALRALATRRSSASPTAPANAGIPAGNAASMANGTKSAAEAEGELASRVFACFKAGEAIEDVIEKLKISPATALALWDQFERVRAVGTMTGPTINERVTAVEARQNEMALGFDPTFPGTLASQLSALTERVRRNEEYVVGLLVPHRNALSCRCGCRGYGTITVRCPCGAENSYGFPVPRQ